MLSKLNVSFEFKINLKYIIAQGLYWMLLCCTTSFASAYMSKRGYSTATIGLLLGLAFLAAIFLQQIMTSYVDASSKINEMDVIMALSTTMCFAMLISLLSKDKGFVTCLCFFAGVAITAIIIPFLNALNFSLERCGVTMNYGLARANGSLFFFLSSLIVGALMNNLTVKAAPFFALAFSALLVVVMISLNLDLKAEGISLNTNVSFIDSQNNDLFSYNEAKEFIEEHKMFFVFLIGMIGYYFGHMLVNNFLYQITVGAGGDTGDNGGLLALQAIVELPAMVFFLKLKDKFGCKFLLGFSGVFFVMKIFFTAIATSVGMLYFSMFFQALAFAVFIPASVHFVDEIMDEKDAVKGQGFVTISMTIGSLLASILGGIIINIFSVTVALWFGSIISLAGAVISIYGLVRINGKN